MTLQNSIRRLVLLAIILVGCFACEEDTEPAAPAPGDSAEPAGALPELSIRKGSDKLLLTWVDDKGDFHVVQKVSAVPDGSRKQVRVVHTERQAGTGKLVYVADLRKPKQDGTYPITTMTRAAWDEIGAAKRKKRLEAIKPAAEPPEEAAASHAPGKLSAIVYGADWCKPCHQAERYLKKRGVKVVKKDIEQDAVANREMRTKLERARLPGASIPIIDIMGELLVGFSPAAIDRALKSVQGTRKL